MEINATTLTNYLMTLLSNGRPSGVPAISGESGIGKTTIVGQVAEKLGMSFEVLPVSQLNPEDLGILTNAPGKYAKFQLSDIFNVPSDEKGRLICLDELNRPSSDTVMNFVMGMVCERCLFGMELDPRIIFVATLNPSGTGEYPETRDIFSDLALRRRFNIVTLNFEARPFLEYSESAGMNQKLLDFLKQNPSEILVKGEPNSPRLWHMLSDVLNRAPAVQWKADNISDLRILSSMYMTASTAAKWSKFWLDLLESAVKGEDILQGSTKTRDKLKDLVAKNRVDLLDVSNQDLLSVIRGRLSVTTKELNRLADYLLLLPSQSAMTLCMDMLAGDEYPIQELIQSRFLKKDLQPLVDLFSAVARK